LRAPLAGTVTVPEVLRAFLQLVISPFFWEKTAHGLDLPHVVEAEA